MSKSASFDSFERRMVRVWFNLTWHGSRAQTAGCVGIRRAEPVQPEQDYSYPVNVCHFVAPDYNVLPSSVELSMVHDEITRCHKGAEFAIEAPSRRAAVAYVQRIFRPMAQPQYQGPNPFTQNSCRRPWSYSR